MSQSGQEYGDQIQYLAQGRPKGRSLRPLRTLWPFIRPFRFRILGATIALLISSSATH